ncbi:hypothetical protein F477_02821 [Pseudomonas sp. URIL14HWK12:I3]|uniref:hypothetical protein n=1 Tax=unclassified Pseudomonas TaxID=196821 RepID=UPI000DB74C40|nr:MULTISPECIES: hypothetical protein [unclassified Pseudomonas]PZW46714.1 hypothetical protein F478_04284 [Pseudomonas sp. URIL14HWK12:I2]PZW55309.1 hypothetical protein F477_02821 [Pseudomonas sp. URIL14HWK12:I3]
MKDYNTKNSRTHNLHQPNDHKSRLALAKTYALECSTLSAEKIPKIMRHQSYEIPEIYLKGFATKKIRNITSTALPYR